jgi:O-antigen ligase
MQKIVTVVHWFNLLAALFLTATMMFEFVDVPWGLLPQFLFFSSYIVEFFLDKKWRRVTLNKTHLYFLVMFGFFGLALVYYPFDSTTYFRVLLERRYALAGFAFVGFFGVNDKYKLSYFLNLFVVTSLLIIVYLLVVRIGLPDFFESDQKIRLFNRTRTAYVNQHMGFNLFLDLALVSIWYLFKSSWRLMPIWKRVVYFLSAGIFLSCLLISEGRAGFLITIVLVCVIIGFELWERLSKWGLLVAFILVVIAIGFASQHQRIRNMRIEGDPRVFLWQSAWTVIKEKPLLGHGISTAQEHFNIERERNQTSSFEYEVKTMWPDVIIDSHNQVTQTWMEFGLLGVCFLMYLWLSPLLIVDKKRRLFTLLMLLLCVNQAMFNPFITGSSSALFGVITLLLLRVPNNLSLSNKTD